MANIFGRQVAIPLTNKSGGEVIAGDVVIVDTSNDGAFTTTTTAGHTGSIGVAQETIANNATGRVLVSGYAALVNVPASVTRGHFAKTHTVAKQATGTSSRGGGSFGQFLTGGTTPTAWLWGLPDGGGAGELVATSTIWDAAGDLAVGTGDNTAARLAIGNAGAVLARINGAVAWNAGTSFPTAATGDRYFRTDRGLEYYYDGTQWVSTQLFTAHCHTDALSGTDAKAIRFAVPPGASAIYAVDWTVEYIVVSTNDGSRYWTVELRKLTTTSATVIASPNTQSQTSDQDHSMSATINAVITDTLTGMYARQVKTSTPGNIIWGGMFRYRLIG